MLGRGLGVAYRRLGAPYLHLALVGVLALGHLVLGGVGLLRLYVDLDAGELWSIVGVTQALLLVEDVLFGRIAVCLLRDAEAWLHGAHGPEASAAAWSSLVELPRASLRQSGLVPVAITVLPSALFITWELGLALWAVPVVVAGALVVLAYGLFLRFFVGELALRPVLDDVVRGLPDGFGLRAGAVSLRTRLLAGLPLINVVTGVLVAGLSTDGTADLRDLGVDVLVAVGVAFTISLELTLLLGRSILGPLGDLQRATERVAAGDLSARVPVVTADETGHLAQSFNAMVAGLDERERLREAFGSYVDPGLADRVLRDGVQLAGEEVEVTVLFLDVRGFTAFAEGAAPAEVVAALNELFARVVPVVAAHGGYANKFVGDGLMAVFGAPERREDHADRAVAAALEIVARLREGEGPGLRVGVGVNSGPVVAGTVGGGGRVEFTVIGDAVNTASRVEGVTRTTGDDVLVTDATFRRLRRPPLGWERRPAVALKGKAQRVGLWAPPAAASDEVIDGSVPSRVAARG